jgi:hypothetical protein
MIYSMNLWYLAQIASYLLCIIVYMEKKIFEIWIHTLQILGPPLGPEALKRRLRDDGHGEAETLARAMDDAGVVLLFRDKAYLHPDKVSILLLLPS